jgi:hypothetical protein
VARQPEIADAGRFLLFGLVHSDEGLSMIRLLSFYMQELHHNRTYWITRYERRRAALLLLTLFAVIAFGVLMWLVQR